MIKKVFILFLFFQLGFAQKVINDSLISKFERNLVYKAIKVSKIPDLRNDTLSDFYFRLNHADLIIDLYQDDYGKLILKSTQYFIKIKNNIVKDAIVFTKLHDPKIANWLYAYVSNSKLENMIPAKKRTTKLNRQNSPKAVFRKHICFSVTNLYIPSRKALCRRLNFFVVRNALISCRTSCQTRDPLICLWFMQQYRLLQ